jgi:NAD(P)-dependent dehydrogenase (short-subunit alcohol dehydrogenase family)
MHGKTVLITGANQGVGKQSAIELGKMGAKLILVCRSADKGKAAVADVQSAGAKDVELLVGDVGSQIDVRRLAAEVKAKHGKLDVLLNNAGAVMHARRETKDGLEETFAVNHIGYFLLTTLLLDLLKASAPARIVSVSSEAHRSATMKWNDLQMKSGWSALASYGQSKLCNILFTRELARRLEGTRVTANCLHPGVVATGFGHKEGGFIHFALTLAKPLLMTPEKGARTQVWLASSPEVEGVSGKYFDKQKERQTSKAAQEQDAPERLWAISEKLVAASA